MALTLTTAVAAGGTVNIVASGVNPIAGTTQGVHGVYNADRRQWAARRSGRQNATNTVNFGSSVKTVTLAVSPLVAGASATYTVGFTASSGPANSVTVAEPNTSFTGVSGVLITDTTGGWHVVTNSPGISRWPTS